LERKPFWPPTNMSLVRWHARVEDGLAPSSQGVVVKAAKLSLLVLVTLALTLSARANNGKTLSFRTEVILNGTKLPTGFYEISWVTHSPEATVTFVKAGQLMVTAMGKFVDRDIKYNADSVLYTNNPDGSHTLIEIRFGGRKQALVFTGAN
jgi:hypothetical protein